MYVWEFTAFGLAWLGFASVACTARACRPVNSHFPFLKFIIIIIIIIPLFVGRNFARTHSTTSPPLASELNCKLLSAETSSHLYSQTPYKSTQKCTWNEYIFFSFRFCSSPRFVKGFYVSELSNRNRNRYSRFSLFLIHSHGFSLVTCLLLPLLVPKASFSCTGHTSTHSHSNSTHSSTLCSFFSSSLCASFLVLFPCCFS